MNSVQESLARESIAYQSTELALTSEILNRAGIEYGATMNFDELLSIFKTFGKRSVCQYQFRR